MRGVRRTGMLAATLLIASPLPWVLYAIGISRGQEEWSAVVPVATALLVAAGQRFSNVRIISEPRT